MKKKILAICGSVRKASVNRAILNYIAQRFKDTLTVEIYDKTDQLPIFNPDFEGDLLPPIVKELQTKIEQADGILISTPEYVFSLPGNLKNLLEWQVSTTLFSQKQTAIIVAAASGQKAFESLDLVMSTITCQPIPSDLKLLLQGIGKKVDADGQITDKKVMNKVHQLTKSFIRQMNS